MAKVLGPPPVRLCKALGCRKPVHENDRCLLHWHRQIEREEYAAREAERAATVKLAGGDKAIRHCTVRSCDRPSHARGLCLAHYERFMSDNKTPLDAWDPATRPPQWRDGDPAPYPGGHDGGRVPVRQPLPEETTFSFP
jgi:hypothetical protein